MTGWFCLLLSVALVAPSCSKTPEDNVTDIVYKLADAIDSHDTAAASRLYQGSRINPVLAEGDSSTVYRMLHIPGGSNFRAANVKATILGPSAQAEFDLSGEVRRDNSGQVAGTMNLRLKIDLEKDSDGTWKIIPGAESRP